MKIKELRRLQIGNVINYQSRESLVIMNGYHEFKLQNSKGSSNVKFTSPEIDFIELSLDWLLKMGGKWDGDYVVIKKGLMYIWSILPNLEPTEFNLEFNNNFIKKLKYVHEVQQSFDFFDEELVLQD